MNAEQISGQVDLALGANQYLTFSLADEEYGVDILSVREIMGWGAATPIPNVPSYIKGVINLRGTIIPIIDLRERFNLEKQPYGPTTVVVVLQVKGAKSQKTVGVVVDAVCDVYDIDAASLNPAPDFGGAFDTEFVRGLATVSDKMIILLDIERLVEVGVLKAIT
ncbi:MAG: chemotaxis protein CheW [Gammaproteobacteria bacterium]|nr:chemotaxis protein CheW [Gammaproteobacteria bacterium]